MTLKGDGTIILDGRRIPMPEGTVIRVSPEVNRAIGNDSKRDVVFLCMGAVPPKNFPLAGARCWATASRTGTRCRAGRRRKQNRTAVSHRTGMLPDMA